jgi:glycosyltransferase involved in cell wall biosynthesis
MRIGIDLCPIQTQQSRNRGDDPRGMAAILESLLTKPDLQQQLHERGFALAQPFSWRRMAEETLPVYRKVVDAPLPFITVRPSRLKIAYWSPLNPCKSGISDYSEQLLPHLAQYADIDIYVDGYVPSTDAITHQFAVYDYGAYSALASSRHYDVNLYQMGNSLFHEYMYQALLARPGVVVLHDYILQGFVYHITEARGQRGRYLDEIEYNEGRAAREQVERDLAGDQQDLYAYPLNQRVIQASRGIIVHSRWMRSQLEKRSADKPIAVISQGTPVLPGSQGRNRQLRARLDLAPDTLVIGCFGRMVWTKRIETTVRAFSRLHRVFPRSILFLVGELDDLAADYIERAAARYGLEDSLRITGYVPAETFDVYLQICDICINLRYPSAGETSASLCRALGAGMPVLASNLDAFTDFPDECVWKVDLDLYEEDELVAYLLDLAFHPELRRQMGQNALAYVVEHATWPKVAARYIEFLEQIAARPR